MSDDISDEDRAELGTGKKRTYGRDLTAEELLMCPLRDCPGTMSVERTCTWRGKEFWRVWCPVCRGWITEYTCTGDEDPYLKGIDLWLEMRKEMRSGGE